MKEEDIKKVLSGETDVAKMGDAEFKELVKSLEKLYFARVMNCVDGTGKSDKEWTALSNIFRRAVDIISEKPQGNAAKLREALVTIQNCDIGKEEDCITLYRVCDDALAAPARNCDKFTTVEDAYEKFMGVPMRTMDYFAKWLLDTAKETGERMEAINMAKAQKSRKRV